MEIVSRILEPHLGKSAETTNTIDFYQDFRNIIVQPSFLHSLSDTTDNMKIDSAEANWLLMFLKDILSLKNDRVGVNIHNITYNCDRTNRMCTFGFSLKRNFRNSFFSIMIRNQHSETCQVSYRFDKALLLTRLRDLISGGQYQSFEAMWISLSTLFPTMSNIKPEVYRRYWTINRITPQDHQITNSSLLAYSRSLKEEEKGFFCVGCNLEGDKFNSIYSTNSLLNSLQNYENLCLDGTYKLTWQIFVVIIVGGLTHEGKFRLVSISLTNSETTNAYDFILSTLKAYCNDNVIQFSPNAIVSDGAASIKSAVRINFECIKHIICWAHVARNLNKKIPNVNIEIKRRCYSDLNYLQKAPTKTIFDKAVNVFLRKYEEYPFLDEFLRFFKNNYIDNNCNWWTGYYLFCSSTNNAIEGFNSAIKRNYTSYRRNHLISLIDVLGKVIESKSNNTIYHSLLGSNHVFYSTKDVIEMDFTLIGNVQTQFHYLLAEEMNSNDTQRCSDERTKELLYTGSNFVSFREYKAFLSRKIVVYDASRDKRWESFFCGCLKYRIQRKCDHILYVATKQLKMTGLLYSIGNTRYRGRPNSIPRRAGLQRDA
eukprot:GAHX01000828.1.p1 GENE.GAHX01000828.1~~GAHX01000828.1.p1  ORF type:complete len:597 (-),score=41.61 GAHX01000828.1:39-1829(-)